MRVGCFAFLVFLSLASLPALAGELKVRVVDPDQLAVAGARVSVYRAESSIAVAVQTTTAAGGADFTAIADGAYHVEVLAPGFAAHWSRVEVPQSSAHQVKLAPAPRAETVVVTAAGTPLPVDDGGAPAVLLDRAELETMRPVAHLGHVEVVPVGSHAVRGAIERYQPLVSVHGHIHECRAIHRLGRTVAINPGSEYASGRIHGALFEIKNGRLKSNQLVVG